MLLTEILNEINNLKVMHKYTHLGSIVAKKWFFHLFKLLNVNIFDFKIWRISQ